MLFGVPVFVSEYAPNTFTTGLYVGIIGDFSFYWTADALDFSIQRLNELYAATNQTGFIGRLESDGMPVLEEAFVRVKLA
jgi:HK97 family phage major capsid protein